MFPLILILLLFAGCSVQGGDSLLSPPNLPSEYVELQKQLDAIVAQGAKYVTAETGTDRQSVKLVDLDRDGYNEAVAFFRMDDGMLRAYLFEYDQGGYYQVGYIEGAGARQIYSVEFIEYVSGGWVAVALSWRYDETENLGLTVFRYGGGHMDTILQTRYKSILYADLYGSGKLSIFTASVNDVTGAHRVRRFQFSSSEECYKQNMEVSMCSEVRSIVSMQYCDGLLYVDSAAHGGGYVTDIVKESFNITMDDMFGLDGSTYRQAAVFCTDIDGDGQIEVPMAEKSGSGRIGWYRYSGSAFHMQKVHVAETCYSIADGWYMFWPESWQDNVESQRTVTDGVSMTTFFVPVTAGASGEVRNALLTVYTFSGEGSTQKLQSYSGVRVLKTVGSTIYAYSAMPNDFPEYSLDDRQMTQLFRIIEQIEFEEGF